MDAVIMNYVGTNEAPSEEVQELIRYKPHWIIRKGNTFFFLVLATFITLTWFVKYPDIIKGHMTLVALNAPKLVIAKTEGKLEKLLVENEQNVSQGQPLAFLQSTAAHKQVLELQKWIEKKESFFLKDSFKVLLSDPLPFFDMLGEIQPVYQDFQTIEEETLQILANGYYQQKKRALLKDKNYLSSIQNSDYEQLKLVKQDYELQQLEYKANESLAKEKVIAPLELNQYKSKVISKEQNLQQAYAKLINNDIASHNKQKEIIDLEKSIIDRKQKFRSEFFNLKSKIETWIHQYIVVAPQGGKVLFASFLQDNQLLSVGQELFYIQPPQKQYYGQMMVPQAGLGKIKIGQTVIIRVESYPSAEFGYLTGHVNFIYNISTAKDSFLLKVDLQNGLQTSYNKTVFFRNGLSAKAEIVTDDRKLADRLLEQLKNINRR